MDSIIAMKVVKDVSHFSKWSDCKRYFNSKKSMINSCYVYMISPDYQFESILESGCKRKNVLFDFSNGAPIDEGVEVGAFDGYPILLHKFIPQSTNKFALLLVNAGDLQYRCIDCSEMNYHVPSVFPYNKYVKVVFPLPAE